MRQIKKLDLQKQSENLCKKICTGVIKSKPQAKAMLD